MTPVTTPNRPALFRIRPYQERAHAAIREAWASDVPGAMIVMATGTGKTATALSLVVQDFIRQGKRVAWLAHREELLTQPRDAVAESWPEWSALTGIVQADRDDVGAQLVLASVATLACAAGLIGVLTHPTVFTEQPFTAALALG